MPGRQAAPPQSALVLQSGMRVQLQAQKPRNFRAAASSIALVSDLQSDAAAAVVSEVSSARKLTWAASRIAAQGEAASREGAGSAPGAPEGVLDGAMAGALAVWSVAGLGDAPASAGVAAKTARAQRKSRITRIGTLTSSMAPPS